MAVIEDAAPVEAPPAAAKRLLSTLGPGVITGYATLWTALVSVPMMAAVLLAYVGSALFAHPGWTEVLWARSCHACPWTRRDG